MRSLPPLLSPRRSLSLIFVSVRVSLPSSLSAQLLSHSCLAPPSVSLVWLPPTSFVLLGCSASLLCGDGSGCPRPGLQLSGSGQGASRVPAPAWPTRPGMGPSGSSSAAAWGTAPAVPHVSSESPRTGRRWANRGCSETLQAALGRAEPLPEALAPPRQEPGNRTRTAAGI